jgi:glycosyltransferase involved in cell wall biosynthesis
LPNLKYNILVVNDFAYVEGGASQVAISSAIGLATKGYDVTYLSAVGPIASELSESRVRVITTGQHAIAVDPSRIRATIQGLWNRESSRLLGTILDGMVPERSILHLHGWTKALSSSVVRLAVRRGFPIVCTLNDYFTACPNGSFLDYPRSEVCTRKPLGGNCLVTQCDSRGYPHKMWRVLRQHVQQRYGLIPHAIRHFIKVSDFSANILSPYLPPDAKLYALPNIIDVPFLPPVQVNANSAYTMVGRLSHEKGPVCFADAARRGPFKAVFIGEGNSRNSVESICPAAEVTGWCSRSQLFARLRQARALVFPSVWYEAQPLVIREAAAMGIPAIVSDRCAGRDDVMNGVTGLWFKGGDVADLILQLRRLQDDKLVEAMGQAAYRHYWENPATVDRHVAQLESIYEEILGISRMEQDFHRRNDVDHRTSCQGARTNL